MKIDVKFEKAINHDEEARKILQKADKLKMSYVEVLNEYVLDELIETLSPTQQKLIHWIVKYDNSKTKINEAYNDGIDEMAQEVRDMIRYIEKRIQR
jgi:hypothetical protein